MTPVLMNALDDNLMGAPPEYQTPAMRPTLAEAQAWCKHLATTHYENFHVATLFLPAALRPHFHSIYAFCRASDDLGDEVADTATATRLLGQWRAMLHECFEQPKASRHPVFVALQPTIAACKLPREPFDDLISAFEEDQIVTHHASIASLERYSRYSANPVGRLVLLTAGYRSPECFALSDDICTALQLANFYQDVVEDDERGRRYLPGDIMARFNVTDAQIHERRFDENFRSMMKYLVDVTQTRLTRGERIVQCVDRDLAATLTLFARGGHAILDAIAARGYDTLGRRPVVTKAVKIRLLLGALGGKIAATLLPGKRGTKKVRP
jgi:squalene synthase HpnC